jgi:hypothetical protein
VEKNNIKYCHNICKCKKYRKYIFSTLLLVASLTWFILKFYYSYFQTLVFFFLIFFYFNFLYIILINSIQLFLEVNLKWFFWSTEIWSSKVDKKPRKEYFVLLKRRPWKLRIRKEYTRYCLVFFLFILVYFGRLCWYILGIFWYILVYFFLVKMLFSYSIIQYFLVYIVSLVFV